MTFIEEVTASLDNPLEWKNTIVIFPNRRAGVFFRQALAEAAKGKPVFAPEIYSLEDFVYHHIPLQAADNLTLTGHLYRCYKNVFPHPEPFADFFFWGKMILRDFDDLDQHLADAKAVYSIVEQQKQLDLGFGFLSAEQIKILSQFWKKFTEDPTAHKEHFVQVWKRLYPLYEDFIALLKKEGLAYKGMAYRNFLQNPASFIPLGNKQFVFAGFNALTKAEEEILTFFTNNAKTTIHWDADAYYVDDKAQEAGRFLRQLSSNTLLSKTFPTRFPCRISERTEAVKIIGVPYRAGQAKYVGQEVERLLKENPELPLHKIAIVLPDEQLLFSVLNSLPESVDKFNVTMGFPVETTPLFSLLLHCLNLQEYLSKGTENIFFRPVMKILKHPIIQQLSGEETDKFVKSIYRNNTIYIGSDELADLHPLFGNIFKTSGEKYTNYLNNILDQLSIYEENLHPEHVTALNFIKKQLYELQSFEKELSMNHNLRNFTRFLRQLLSSEKIPFEGEPLRGLQIMGVLETRNLDFDYIFVLSLNEEFFPADSRQKSFIPYNIRKAFTLPVFDQQDAIYAYLFYRLFQRSSHLTLLYNTEGNDIGGQEMSRFLQQLIYEKPFPTHQFFLNTPVKSQPADVITIQKDDVVLGRLEQFLFSKDQKPARWLYPSTLYSYLHCRLQFYYRYVAGIKEADEVDEEVDARIFGNILHNCIEKLYRHQMKEKSSTIIEEEDILKLKKLISAFLEEEFKLQFGGKPEQKYNYTGQNIIQRDILVRFISKILDHDLPLTPFRIIALETDNADGYEIGFPVRLNGEEHHVGLKGKIDRLDEVNGSIRVIDYKTGKDSLIFSEVNDLFERDGGNGNKAAFQTLYYSLLYAAKHQATQPVTPGLYSRTNLFSDSFDYRLTMKNSKTVITDYKMVQEEYETLVKELLEELFNPEVPFDQTTDLNHCNYCPYRGICRR